MELRRINLSELPAVYELLLANGWQHRIETLSQFEALIAASPVAEVAIIDDCVVGFVRGITDGLSNGYLSMVVVAQEYRGRGIGRQLIEHVIDTNHKVTWVLRAGRVGAAEFFTKLGFEPSSIAMERKRK